MTDSAVFCVRVSGSVIEALGLLLTVWRIYFRIKIGRFWWEDAWAAILLPTGLSWIVSSWVYVLAARDGSASTVAAWFSSIAFTCIVTFGRMSILFSIIRIVHGGLLLKFSYACAAFFAASWAVLVVEKVIRCAWSSSQHSRVVTKSVCSMTVQMTIFELTTDCVAVFILVVLPLRILWRVKLPKRQRRMILAIFASSVVLAFAAVFHTVGEILDVVIVMIAGLHVEAALSIIVCNLLVVVTYTCHALARDRAGATSAEGNDNDDDFTTRQRPPAPATTSPASGLSLTTVDLDISLNSQGSSSQRSGNRFKESV